MTHRVEKDIVGSSMLLHLAHEGKTLFATFKGNKRYFYPNVDRQVFDEIINAESVGKTFKRLILDDPD